jgi:hypothetical protein
MPEEKKPLREQYLKAAWDKATPEKRAAIVKKQEDLAAAGDIGAKRWLEKVRPMKPKAK